LGQHPIIVHMANSGHSGSPKEAAVNRLEADLAFAGRPTTRRMPSAEILARYQADARDAAKRTNPRGNTTASKLRAFLIAMAAPDAASLR
jgi:hypothetical protein